MKITRVRRAVGKPARTGVYSLILLPPGNYAVSFSAPGFKTSEVNNVKVNVTETPVLDRSLEVGSQSDQITVEANVEAVQTSSSTLGTVVAERAVSGLPRMTRNYTQIIGPSAFRIRTRLTRSPRSPVEGSSLAARLDTFIRSTLRRAARSGRCSCYPWPVPGLPPVWYKSGALSLPRGDRPSWPVEGVWS